MTRIDALGPTFVSFLQSFVSFVEALKALRSG